MIEMPLVVADDTTAEHILLKVRIYDANDFIYVRFSFLSNIRNNAQHYLQNFRYQSPHSSFTEHII